MSERDICDGMEQHEHGTRYVDDEGRCLACSVKARDAEIAALREWVRVLEESVERLKVDSDMLHYTFHHGEEDWFPMKFTYGMWCRDVCRVMIERGYWSRGVPGVANAIAALRLPTTLEGAGGEVRADAPSEAVEGV